MGRSLRTAGDSASCSNGGHWFSITSSSGVQHRQRRIGSITLPAGIGQKGACIHKARGSRRITHNLGYAAQAVHLVFGVPRLCTCVRASFICVLCVWNGAWFMCAIWWGAHSCGAWFMCQRVYHLIPPSRFLTQPVFWPTPFPLPTTRLIMRASTHAHGV